MIRSQATKMAAATLTILLSCVPVFAKMGGTTGGGGDVLALDFYKSGTDAIAALENMNPSIATGVNFGILQGKLDNVDVLVVDEDLHTPDGEFIQNSTAENFPEKNLILINRARWSALASALMKQALALHEALSLLGIESTGNYKISKKFYALASTTPPVLEEGLKLLSYPTGFFTETTQGSIPTIYAGMTANNGACSGPLCDSCAALTTSDITSSTVSATSGSGTVCSVKETHSTDSFTFSISSSKTKLATTPGIVFIQFGSNAAIAATPIAATGPGFTGEPTQYSVTWAQICQAISTDATCSTSFPASALSIGWSTTGGATLEETVQVAIAFRYVSESPAYASFCKPPYTGPFTPFEGFCYFTVSSRNEGAAIFAKSNSANSYLVPDLEPAGTSTNQDPSGMTYAGLAVFYTTTNPAAGPFTPSGPKQILSLANSSDGIIQGLTNGKPYYFSIASVDQAGILTFFSQPNQLDYTDVDDAGPEGDSQITIPKKK